MGTTTVGITGEPPHQHGNFSVSDSRDSCCSPEGKRHCSGCASSSPTSVTAMPHASLSRDAVRIPSPVPPNAENGIGVPAKDPDAIMVRSLMARHVRTIYREFCSQGSFMYTDIYESRGLLSTPMEDPMGVCVAAVSILRAFYTDERARDIFRPGMFMNLHPQARHYMAAALYLAYKAKSEDSWQGGTMTRAVLSRFVTELEYPDAFSRRRMAEIVVEAELNLLNELPILSLLDANIHSVIEYQLGLLMKEPEPVVTPTAAIAILSAFGIHYATVSADTETELVEEMCEKHSIGEVAMAFVAVGAALMQGCPSVFDKGDIPGSNLHFSCTSLQIAKRIIAATVRKDIDRSGVTAKSAALIAMTLRTTILAAHAVIEAAAVAGPYASLAAPPDVY